MSPAAQVVPGARTEGGTDTLNSSVGLTCDTVLECLMSRCATCETTAATCSTVSSTARG
jgi:hypothetical protein